MSFTAPAEGVVKQYGGPVTISQLDSLISRTNLTNVNSDVLGVVRFFVARGKVVGPEINRNTWTIGIPPAVRVSFSFRKEQ